MKIWDSVYTYSKTVKHVDTFINLFLKYVEYMSPVSPIFHIIFGSFWNTQGLDMERDLMRPNNI